MNKFSDIILPKPYLERFGFYHSKNFTSKMWYNNVISYKLVRYEIYLAQWDYRANEDLRAKELWCLMGRKFIKKEKKTFIKIITNDLVCDGQEFRVVLNDFITDLDEL